MRPRGSVVPVLAGGVGGVVKLLVATLAFAGVYLGVWGTPGAQAPVRVSADETVQGPVRLVVLSSRSAPVGPGGAVKARDTGSRAARTRHARTRPARTQDTRTRHAGTQATKARTAGTRTVRDGTAAGPATVGRAPATGEIAVGEGGALGPCDSPYLARAVIGNDDPRATVSYAWRLERWSSATHRWHTYLNAGGGFTGEGQAVEWRPRIVGNPGRYRVVLSVQGESPLRSERFLVTC
ncbi:hypothetical protein [Streptosporangium sp. NPDC023615]|uniref:hypothetical protein n=1 Tax=Streptosporangium sp. NPDC023615 TaxID=3154794 RepID=UPI003446F59C